ncbi:MAG: hypothetical protein HY958_10430 [Bacteroidia bacterium]|nr:hypothetical protein [Bacteroidia bacterium]
MGNNILNFLPAGRQGILALAILFSCSISGNKPDAANIKCNTKDSVAGNTKEVIDAPDIPFDINECKSGKNEQSPEFISSRIEELIGKSLKKWVTEKNLNYPPSCILFRVFKIEQEYEIWAGNSMENLTHIKTIKICAFDGEPGPKLTTSDGKTPEGFYYCDISYGSKYWWMWMKLTPDDVDKSGEASRGSSFKMCINYPNAADAERTKKFMKGKNPGGEICIHGNCVSAGCISFKNRAFLPVYYFATKHNTAKYGKLQIHIFPFRFTEKLKSRYCDSYSKIDGKSLKSFWDNLEEGYRLFNKNHRLLNFSYQQDKYIFKD